MTNFQAYILESGICFSILFTIFLLILRNEQQYMLNRIFLLSAVIFSSILPFVNVNISTTLPVSENLIETINISAPTQTATNNFQLLKILLIIYISGATFFFLKFVSSLVKIYYLYNRFPRQKHHGFTAVLLDTEQSPFTMFNVLFIAKSDLNESEENEIITHETAHRKQLHTIDVLLIELFSIVHWFNPFTWLLRNQSQLQNEFIADKQVLNKGFNPGNYQKLLFEKSTGISPAAFLNNFNYSILKKRLKMMTTNKSGFLTELKYAISFPLLLVVLFAFTTTSNTFSQDETIHTTVDVMPEYPGGITQLQTDIMSNIVYPKTAIETQTSAKVFVSFVVNKNGGVTDVKVNRSDILDNQTKEIVVVGYMKNDNTVADIKAVTDLENEAMRAVGHLKRFIPGEIKGEKVNVIYTVPVLFALDDKNK